MYIIYVSYIFTDSFIVNPGTHNGGQLQQSQRQSSPAVWSIPNYG